MALIAQEVSRERAIEIPDEVRDVYRQWRPTPLYRARRLERFLDTPARIYYKYEGVSPAGSHKPNTAVPQAYYNKAEGIKRIATETGAGQWGSALAFAGSLLGLEVEVYMVKVSFDQKPYRRALMETYGARCVASPSDETESGRKMLAEHPDSTGRLGIAISEAVEVAARRDDTNYALGSVLNHVLLHQTVIGQEAILQLELAGDYPDIIVGCTGGGSNFAGIAFPFIGAKLRGGPKVEVIAVEPAACPSLTRGKYAYDFGDTGPPDAAGQDAHAGLRVHPAGLPRRRPALPRHGADGQPPARPAPDRARSPTTSSSASRPASSSPASRASCRRPRRTTRSRARSTRRSAARPPARAR